MTILHRHMLKEVLVAVAMATGGFLFVMVIGNLLKGPLAEVLNGRIPWSVFFELTGMLIPGVAPYVLPIGILTGVLLVLGRMSAQNEITAMKASGMSLWRITSPIVAIGLVGCIAAVFVNFEYAPWANARFKVIVRDALKENCTALIVEKTAVTDFPGLLIYADRREGETLRDVWIWRAEKLPSGDYGPDSELIRAGRAEIVTRPAEGGGDDSSAVMSVRLSDVVVERRERAGGDSPESLGIGGARETSLEIPLGKLTAGGTGKKKLNHHTLTELMALRRDGYELKEGATDEERFANRIRVQTQIQSNLAGAFGILSLTLLAIPLGIRVSRSETFVNFAVALALAIGYYLLTVAISWIRVPQLRPDILVWLPNIVIQVVAARMFLKAART